VSLDDIAQVLADRAGHAGLAIPEPLATRLIVYYQVLSHWNRKINLTSLSDPDEAVDRLLLEPVAAATRLPHAVELVDLGSGGGSPAVPLALAIDAPYLVMVESRVRKTSFLREVLREVGMAGTVEAERFETVAGKAEYQGRFPLLSVRAVRLDASTFASIVRLLRPRGQAALFRTVDAPDPPEHLPAGLLWTSSTQLIPASHSALALLERST
jgi:16S rRNA (guanine527-N7)-methyltransferase